MADSACHASDVDASFRASIRTKLAVVGRIRDEGYVAEAIQTFHSCNPDCVGPLDDGTLDN